MTKIIVAGSRNFQDEGLLFNALDKIISEIDDNNIEIVHGNCRGADLIGEKYALANDLKVIAFPAYWELFGKKAGVLRNEEMAKYASKNNGILVAFPIGESKGTRNMIKLAKQYGLKTYIIER